MTDFLLTVPVMVVGAMLVAFASSGFSRREKKWVTMCFAMHVGFACVQVPLVLSLFGGGDMFRYFTYGELLAAMMERDPTHVIPEVTRLLLHGHPNLPILILGAGTGTGSMSALAAWAFFVLGPSQYAVCVAFGILSLCGKLAVYRVFRANLEPSFRGAAAAAALFVPSFVFWSSGLIKEAIVVAGFGWGLYGLDLWLRGGRPGAGIAWIAAGMAPLFLIKPYVLFPFILASGSWYYWSRSIQRGRLQLRPLQLGVAAALGLGGIVVLGQHFPEYSLDNFAEQSSQLRQLGRQGGSAFALTAERQTTLAGQFVYAPAALLTSLFRPFVFEAHNIPSFVNALETGVLTLLFLRIPFTRNLRGVRQEIADRPMLVFCVVFVAAFGIAVGLASSNLGTLSRYRSPLLPFFVILLLVLNKPSRVKASHTQLAEPREALGVV